MLKRFRITMFKGIKTQPVSVQYGKARSIKINIYKGGTVR